ncbi:MAG: methyltransferase domain-containing protein [Deltaproteobacteria bacterium]|jgi:arsenite methyltransferase|nr:methyltransferase domain-containing protein [Deltaproteobacteria bacterium]
MNPIKVFHIILCETLNKKERERVPEPALVMSDQEHVEAFAAGSDEVLVPLYCLHLEKLANRLKPGDRVLDLGCGSGRLLTRAASFFKDVEFIGLDLSEPMLQSARLWSAQNGVSNVSWQKGDMANLGQFTDSSFDAVTSSLALHHLPDVSALKLAMGEIDRVLKPKGAIILSDLGSIHAERSIQILTDDRRHLDPAPLIEDYENSLRAAFSMRDWRFAMASVSKTDLQAHRSRPLNLFVQIVSPVLATHADAFSSLKQWRKALNLEQKWNHRLLKTFQSV